MNRYMIYLKNGSYKSKDAQSLLLRARELVSDQTIIIRDTRVSESFIEYDTSIPENTRLEEVTRKLVSIAPLLEYEHIVDTKIEKDEGIKIARNLFNTERYWRAHEILESIWKNSYGNEKALLNGIILVAAAFVHHEKNENEICISILKRALMKLERASGYYFGIRLDEIKDLISEIVKTGNVQRFNI
jgi:predicted metal-dependent hydrolase